MNWSALKKNKCPSCEKDLVKTMVSTDPGHIACKCGFKISEQRYQEIVADRVIREIENRAGPTDGYEHHQTDTSET